MSFNHGYGKLPSGNYFQSNEFTLMFMIKILSYKYFALILESSNNHRNKISINFKGNTGELCVWIDDSLIVSSVLTVGKWTHVTIKSGDGKVKIFRDSVDPLSDSNFAAIPLSDSNFAALSHVERSDNFIGYSTIKNSSQHKLNSILDELKIFNRALSNEEIQNEMNVKQPYDILKIN